MTADILAAILAGRELEDADVCDGKPHGGSLDGNIDKLEVCH